MSPDLFDVVKVFAPGVAAFVVGILITPLITSLLYKHKLWKKQSGKTSLDGTPAEVFGQLHKEKEVGTPRFGGSVVWGSVLIVTVVLFLLQLLSDSYTLQGLSFLSRGQTWIPLGALFLGAIVGLIDDALEVRGSLQGGLPLRKRLLIVAVSSLVCAWWFYAKLDVSSIQLPFDGALQLGAWFIPFFLFVALAMYAGGVIDGIDGLAGGIFASMFAAYAGITYFNGQIDLSAFCATVAGALLAFLWFNIPPARFYLSETGTMGLTLSLTVVAFLSDAKVGGIGVFVLPIIAFPLVITVLSIILQLFYKRVLGRKLFYVSPLHHHFEALGWPPYKVVMRYWVVSVVCAIFGITFSLIA